MQKLQPIENRRDTTSVLLLVVVFLSLLRPVSPYISDGFAHTFYNQEHHAMMHLTGVNHVDKEIKKINETEQEGNGKATPSTFSTDNSFVYFIPASQFNFYNVSQDISFRAAFGFELTAIIPPAIQPPDNKCMSLHS